MAKVVSLVEPAWSKKVITAALCMGVAEAFPTHPRGASSEGRER